MCIYVCVCVSVCERQFSNRYGIVFYLKGTTVIGHHREQIIGGINRPSAAATSQERGSQKNRLLALQQQRRGHPGAMATSYAKTTEALPVHAADEITAEIAPRLAHTQALVVVASRQALFFLLFAVIHTTRAPAPLRPSCRIHNTCICICIFS